MQAPQCHLKTLDILRTRISFDEELCCLQFGFEHFKTPTHEEWLGLERQEEPLIRNPIRRIGDIREPGEEVTLLWRRLDQVPVSGILAASIQSNNISGASKGARCRKKRQGTIRFVAFVPIPPAQCFRLSFYPSNERIAVGRSKNGNVLFGREGFAI